MLSFHQHTQYCIIHATLWQDFLFEFSVLICRIFRFLCPTLASASAFRWLISRQISNIVVPLKQTQIKPLASDGKIDEPSSRIGRQQSNVDFLADI